MRKFSFYILSIFLLCLASCSHQDTKQDALSVDTIPMLVTQIQQCSRLYTVEAHVHKIVTHDDDIKLKGSFLKSNFNFTVPGSTRKVAIPMDATVKAYIDFNGFSEKNVQRHGEQIEIILPDPKVTLTSSKIDHEGIKQHVSFIRSDFSDKELSQYEQEGRKAIIHDIPNMQLMETARESAAHVLTPLLVDMGFKEENVKVSFRKKFTFSDIESLLEKTSAGK